MKNQEAMRVSCVNCLVDGDAPCDGDCRDVLSTMPINVRRHLEAFGERDRFLPYACPLCRQVREWWEGVASL